MITLNDWQSGALTWKFGEFDLAYWQSGNSDEHLVCVHGFPTASWDWQKLWPGLTERFTVTAVDMLGFGFSDKPSNHNYSIHEQADLQEQFLVENGIHRFHILAHDYGDSVAQELVARFLDRQNSGAAGLEIQSVIFLNGGLFPEMHRARLIQKLLLSPLGPLLSQLVSKRSVDSGLAAVFGPDTQPNAAELDAFWQMMCHNNGQRLGHKLIRYMLDRKEHRERWLGALQQTVMPMRLIDGVLDPVSGGHLADYYQQVVPKADVIRLNVGHYPQVEDPAGVMAACNDFWNECR